MVETWWEVSWGQIKTAKVAKATDKSVWVKGGREARITTWKSYFPTWAEAHAHLLTQCADSVDRAQRSLHGAEQLLAQVKDMQSPDSVGDTNE